MTRYFVEFNEDGEGNWICNHLDTPTPTTLSTAADLLECVMGTYNHLDEDCFRVIFAGTGIVADNDVTNAVLAFIEDRNEADAREAAEDLRHERQERHGFEQV